MPVRTAITLFAAACCISIAARSSHAQDAAAGKKVFEMYCKACHTVQPNRNLVGPSLFGVVNRPSGHVPGFRYSDANKRSGIVWDVGTLNRYLTAPRQLVPGTFMTFPGIKDDRQRANLIAYLATLN